MKKFLSLVMALIMVMSLVTVASAADYTDAADVDKAEAVEVMSAVGVFQGSAGKFNPKAILNRAEAAKLIAYLDLGEDAAEALPAVQSFSDVPTTHWAAKYIAYCADAGYINGVGNGKFDPTGKLTGYQFGKLVLCVLGYDATIESFTGANWSIAVAKLMQSNDINKKVKAAPSAELTREDAAQYCLNALKATTVEYASKGTNVTINGVVIATGASKAEPVLGGTTAKYGKIDNAKVDGKFTVELGEKLYEGKLVLSELADAFGRTSDVWTYKSKEVGTYADTADFTFTVKTEAKDIAKALKGYKMKDYKVDNDTVSPASFSVNDLSVSSGETIAQAIADDTANGKLVELFADSNDNIINVVEVTYTVGKITKISTNTKTGDVTYYIDGASAGAIKGDKDEDDTIVLAGEVAKDDVVTYASAGSKTYVYPTTVKEGKISQANDNDFVTLDGVKYAASCVADASADAKKVWIDQFGVVCKTDAVDSSVDYVYFAHKYVETVKNVPTYYVQIVTADGEIKEMKVKEYSVYADAAVDCVGTYETASGKITRINKVDSGDVVPMQQNSAIKEGAVKLNTANTENGNIYFFADDVTFVYVDGNGNDLKVTTSNTVDKISKVANGSYAVLDDGEVVAVFIGAKAAASTASSDLLFVADASAKGTMLNDDNKKVDAYEFYLNGVAEKHGVHSDGAGIDTGYFSYAVDKTTGDLILTAETENIFNVTATHDTGAVYEIRKDTYVYLGIDEKGTNTVDDYVNAADAVIYDTTDNNLTTLTDIVNLLKDDNSVSSLTLACVYDDKAEKITLIYVAD